MPNYQPYYLQKAAQQNRIDIVKWLSDNRANPNSKDKVRKKTALHYASENNSLEIVKFLLIEMGATTNIKDAYENAPLHYASSLEVAKCLIENGAEIDAGNNEGKTAFLNSRLLEAALVT